MPDQDMTFLNARCSRLTATTPTQTVPAAPLQTDGLIVLLEAILMAAAGLAFACTRNFLLLILAGTIGVISPSGNEVGPFLSIEQAALSHVVPARTRTEMFALWLHVR